MKTFALLTGIFFSTCFLLPAQNGYWQQKVAYTIEATLDDSKDLVKGKEKLVYTNNSPDDLKELYFHTYWNAFQLESHAMHYAKANGVEEVKKVTKKDEGYMKIVSLRVGGTSYTPKMMETIARVGLTSPVKSNTSVEVEIEFEALVPSCISRAGKNNTAGTDYSMSQWYPKICRYDKQGWHTDPYMGREFAGTFGSFDVSITCNKEFTLAGTGILSGKKYKERGWETTDGTPGINADGKSATWNFKADNVHDFAWAADKEFDHAVVNVNGIDFHFFYHNTKDYTGPWGELISKWKIAYEVCEKEFGKYPYPVFSFIQAGEGYMEYPMCTFLEAGREDFLSTACHEFMHNFFYGMYGTDENLYPWMDEGLTSYAEARLYGAMINNTENPAIEATLYYKWVRTMLPEEPMSTAANYFDNDYAYYNAAYYKGQLFPELIRYIIGDEKMKEGFKKYYTDWSFKHPEPNDFVKNFEDVSNIELTWFQNYWLGTTKTINQGIDTVIFKGQEAQVVLSSQGVPMPVEITVTMKDNSTRLYYIPLALMNNPKTDFEVAHTLLPEWGFGEKNYTFSIPGIKRKDILLLQLDVNNFLPDEDLNNNIFKVK